MRRLLIVLMAIASAMVLAQGASAADEGSKLDEVIVTSSRIAEPVTESVSSMVVITKEEITSSGAQFLPDVLRQVTELNVSQNGGKGKLTSIFMRGASPGQVVVMIDGVKVKGTTAGQFDFANLPVQGIERIEILKGPQSTLYGSEAIGGVINIITKTGAGPLSMGGSYEYGSHSTHDSRLWASAGEKGYSYYLSGSSFYTEGESAIKDGSEKDSYRNASGSGRVDVKLTPALSMQATGAYTYARNELDNFYQDFYDPNSVRDDTNFIQRENFSVYSLKATHTASDKWEQALSYSVTRDILNYSDPDTPMNVAHIDSSIKTAEWQNTIYQGEQNTSIVGIVYAEESGEIKGTYDKSLKQKAVYAASKYRAGNLIYNVGVRQDDHDTFGSEVTYRIGVVEDRKEAHVRYRASYATGYRAPTLNDLYHPWGGNPDLDPERSKGWEIGAEQDYSESTFISITYFKQDYEDLIQWAPVTPEIWMPQNVSKAEVKGLEIGVNYKLAEPTMLKLSYTNLDASNTTNGGRLMHRPNNKFAAQFTHEGKEGSLALSYRYVDKAKSSMGKVGDYNVVDLAVGYNLTQTMKLTARIDNVLDEEYEESSDYPAPGRAYFAGLKMAF